MTGNKKKRKGKEVNKSFLATAVVAGKKSLAEFVSHSLADEFFHFFI